MYTARIYLDNRDLDNIAPDNKYLSFVYPSNKALDNRDLYN
jgi:hypothetical protein